MFEEIRRGYAAGETIKGLAKRQGVHRRMVRQAIANAIPPERKAAEQTQPKLGVVKEAINEMLEEDKAAHRKQRHTAHRVYTRLCEEHPECSIGESTVRRYVRQGRYELGLARDKYIDWFEAYATLSGELCKLQMVAMRSEEGYPIEEVVYPLIVDGRSRVKVKTNFYTAPAPPGSRVTAAVRHYGRGHQILDLEHRPLPRPWPVFQWNYSSQVDELPSRCCRSRRSAGVSGESGHATGGLSG